MALVILVILTMLAVSSLGTTNLEEKMAANAKNKQLALQAAESALVVGENWIATVSPSRPTFPGSGRVGLYLPSTTATPVWEVASNWNTNSVVYPGTPDSSGGTNDLQGIAEAPRYIIEEIQEVANPDGTRTVYYRITARAVGGTTNAIAMVQSVVSRTW